MIIGVPREQKKREFRVGMIPSGVEALVEKGHTVRVEKGAGAAVGYSDEDYAKAGAHMMATPEEVWQSDLMVKVKEPQPQEFSLMHPGQMLFCFLHLAPAPKETQKLRDQTVVGIAYETMRDQAGRLPLLNPMSEIAGRLSFQIGAHYLQKNAGGKGILLSGVPGVKRGRVVIVGGGIAGAEAARMALGCGAEVVVVDKNIARLKELEGQFSGAFTTRYATPSALAEEVARADLLVGSVHTRGEKAAKVITRKMIASMEKGSVFIDISIDQGGCSETSRSTDLDHPTYEEEGVIHYCVPNMPSLVARTSTEALCNATFEWVLELAQKGWKKALKEHPILLSGLNICQGKITHPAVAEAQNQEYVDPSPFLRD
jgi:alanine dehydrogenase